MSIVRTLGVAIVIGCVGCASGSATGPGPAPLGETPLAPAPAPAPPVATETPDSAITPAATLTRKLHSGRDGLTRLALTAHCLERNGECDSASIYLAINGKRIDFHALGGSAPAPFGAWEQINARLISSSPWILELEHEDSYELLSVEFRGQALKATASVLRPKIVTGQIAYNDTWDLEGHFRCTARDSGDAGYCHDVEILGDNKFVFALPPGEYGYAHSSFQLKDLNTRSSTAAMFTANDEYWLLVHHEDSTVPVWHQSTDNLNFYSNGDWSITHTACEREATARRAGKQSFQTTRYHWDGKTIKETVVKRWLDRDSDCSSSGREGIGEGPLWEK